MPYIVQNDAKFRAALHIARLKYQAVNQRGETVLHFTVVHLLRRSAQASFRAPAQR